ncbi:MAG: MFS transporter [Alphaproteobacteria bacterium]|nr:MAG: MFS transporter [Alphaproteobacteria bacterium]
MRAIPNSIIALLISSGLMATANGLQMTLISVRASIEQFSAFSIGLLVSGYFFGFLIGCLFSARLVARVGHTRAFLAYAGIFSATLLCHILFVHPVVWILLRIVIGTTLAGLYMIIESWLNDKAENDNRGQVLGLYRFIELSALTAGQLLLGTFSPAGFKLFCLVAIFISLSLVPLAISRAEGPSPIVNARFRLGTVLEISPVAVAGSLTIGLVGSILFGMGPIFAQGIGLGADGVGLFMSFLIVGGALAQMPLGRLSDRFDRRLVLAFVALSAALAASFLAVALLVGQWLLYLAAMIYGGFCLSQYSLVIAHANDRAEPEQFVQISGSLNLIYAVGAIIGPSAGSWVMGTFGSSALFFTSAVFHAFLGVYAWSRTFVRAEVVHAEKEDFVPVVSSTPEIFEMDPRGEPEPEAAKEPEPEAAEEGAS